MALRADDVDLGRDRDLVARYQGGDPAAFDDLYRRYFDRLHRFCLRIARDTHEAEEIAQEAFVRAFRSMGSLQGERRFYPWLTVIARRISIDRHRKAARIELIEEPDAGADEGHFEHLFDAVDAHHVRTAMANLGPRHRDVLVLREAEELSYAQIAERLEVPMTTVEALLHRARKALRREYAAVAGESRGLLSFPLVALVATRFDRLRARVGDRWLEAAAVAGPVAIGAVTAAVVLAPATTPDRLELEAAAAPTTTIAEPQAVASTLPAPSALVLEVPAVALDGQDPAAPAPVLDAGPVDVFVGPEGTDRARDEAESMPLGGTLGPAAAGIDLDDAAGELRAFVESTLGFLLAPPSDAPAPLGGDR